MKPLYKTDGFKIVLVISIALFGPAIADQLLTMAGV